MGKMTLMVAHALTPCRVCSVASHATRCFFADTASCALWEREGPPAYRKKSAHCSWRAIVADNGLLIVAGLRHGVPAAVPARALPAGARGVTPEFPLAGHAGVPPPRAHYGVP